MNSCRKYTLVDDEDYKFASQFLWRLSANGHVCTTRNSNGKTIYLHHLVFTNPPKGLVIDHINKNAADNRKSNLRIATMSENRLNSKVQKNNKSGYTGVYWDPIHSLWLALIFGVKNRKFLGYFKRKEDAIKARKNFVRIHNIIT